MNRLSQIYRLIQINLVLARYGLDKIILSLHLFSPIRFLVYLNPWRWFNRKKLTQGQAIRCALEELGPIFVKFGQALSTRRDLLPKDVADELSLLQDRVPPFSEKKVTAIIEKAYGKSIKEVFFSFDLKPIASASVAQVHAAQLADGTQVAVKILRPEIKKVIKHDIKLLYAVAKLAEKYLKDGKRLRPVEVVSEFEKTIFDELDLMREAANASQLRRNFSNSKLLYVPRVYWDYTTHNVMVQERIHGIPITDLEALKEHQVDIKKLAERGVEIFFTQVLRDSFFHADMHPGNIFVSYDNPEDPQYICVDFGIMGSLTEKDKNYLAENFHAFFNRDYRRVADLHISSGWIPRETRVDEFESAVRTVCEPIFERPLREISCAYMLLQLFQTGRRFNMPSQPHLVLLQKTLFAIEGLGRQLYPELDLWSTAKPFLERWMKEQYSPQSFLEKIRKHSPYVISRLPEMPNLIFDVLENIKEGQSHIRVLKQQVITKDIESKQDYGVVIGVVFLICAIISSFFDSQLQYTDFTLTPMNLSFTIIGVVSILWSAFRKRFRLKK